MSNIKKVKIKQEKIVSNNQPNILNNQASRINESKIDEVENLELTSYRKVDKSVGESIAKQLDISKEIADDIANQLSYCGYYNPDLENIKAEKGSHNEIIVTLKNGDRLFFVKDGKKYTLDSIIKAHGDILPVSDVKRKINGYDVTLFLTKEEQAEIKYLIDAKETTRINGYVNLTIKGKETKVYWVGDISLEQFMKRVELIEEAMDAYPQNITDIGYGDGFKGFFIGNQDELNKEQQEGLLGFVDFSRFIYLCGDDEDHEFYKETVIHEFAHILDYALGRIDDPYSIDKYSEKDQKMKTLYKKYKKTIQPLLDSGYGEEQTFPDGVPNYMEFFASTIEIYLTAPNELKETIPELYDDIDELFKNV